jgi:bilirubin oxidase
VDDIPLVLTSRRFHLDDQFAFDGDNDKYGDYAFANGTLDAEVSLPAQIVRLPILNAEIERGYDLGFSDGRTFHVIATDGGLVDKPIPVTRMKLMVGERVEVLANLGADKAGSSVDLMALNAGQAFGYPGGEPGTGPPNGSYLNNVNFRLLHINVTPRTARPVTTLPASLVKNRLWTESDTTNQRTIRISGGRPFFNFDDKPYARNVINQTVKLGAVEQWTIRNNNIFGHTFHIHDVQFAIVARTSGVQDYQRGWKDTLYVPRGETVSFVAKFDDYASDTDAFMYHCHMSNHEDGGLMGQFVVVKGGP